MKYFVVITIVIFLIKPAENARILGIWPLQGHSHFVMFERLMKGLAEKGHEVDVLSSFPQKQKIQRYNDYSVADSLPSVVSTLSLDMLDEASPSDFFVVSGVELCETIFKTTSAAEIKHSRKQYDVLITEIFLTDCFLGFAHHFQIPSILLTTSLNLPWAGDRIGLPDNPSYIPISWGTYGTDMNLFERFLNTLLNLAFKFMYEYYSMPGSNKAAKEFFGSDLPDLHELASNTSLLLVNSHFSSNYARPTVPNFIEVAGLHLKDPKPLSKEHEDLVKTDLKGVILFSMGSLVKSDSFSYDKLQGIFDAFKEVPYKVLWKADQSEFNTSLKIPDNVVFDTWLPQMDLLCHPNVKLFITHGGTMGGQEAISCGVPRLGIPLFGDQVINIISAEKAGIGLLLMYKDITKDRFKEAVVKLLEDKSYEKNSKLMAKIFNDRPLSALDTAIYWVEYVIRYKGAPQLRSKGADLPWYKYFLIDVIVIAVIIWCGTAGIVYFLLKLLCFVLNLRKRRTEKYNKND